MHAAAGFPLSSRIAFAVGVACDGLYLCVAIILVLGSR
jgi:hypothetical protein